MVTKNSTPNSLSFLKNIFLVGQQTFVIQVTVGINKNDHYFVFSFSMRGKKATPFAIF